MSGSFPALSIQTPDLLGGLARVEGIRANRLQMLAAQQQFEDSQAFRQAAPDLLPALATAEGPQRQNILAKLSGLGEDGARIALPMMQQERERAQFQQLMGQTFGGGAPAPAAPMPPQGMPGASRETIPQAPQGPIQRTGPFRQGTDPDNVLMAERRRAIMDNPNLTPEQQAAALATVSAEAAAARGVPVIPNGYRANPGIENAYVGTRNPSGVVPGATPGAGAAVPGQALPQGPAGGTDRPVAAAPGAAPQGRGAALPTPQQLFQLAASGNPQAMAFVQRVAPLVQQANPSFGFQNIGGTLYAINPQNPSDMRPIGPAGDPRLLNPEEEAQRVRLAQAGRPSVSVNTERTFTGQLAERGANRVDEMRGQASTAADGIRTADRIATLLDSGVITGTAAETRLGIERALRTAGIIDGRRVANTEQLVAELARTTLPMAESLRGPTSDRDIAFLRDAVAGRIEVTAETIRRMAGLSREYGERAITNYNSVVTPLGADSSIPPAMRQLYSPMSAPDRPAPPAPNGAPSAPIGGSGLTASPPPAAPSPGAVEGGYRFRGGNPADPSAWERVQ